LKTEDIAVKNHLSVSIAVLLLLFVLTGCSIKHDKPTQTGVSQVNAEKVIDPRMQEIFQRKALYDSWIWAAEEVSELSGDPEAVKVVVFLKAESTFAIPGVENGQPSLKPIYYGRTQDEANRDKPLKIVPLLLKDDQLSHHWKKANEEQGGLFAFQVNAIVLSGKLASTPVWKGLVLLHEGSHALRFKEGTYKSNSPEEKCREELYTWAFMLRVVGLVGGQEYATLLQEEVDYIERNSKLPGILAPLGPYNRRLDIIFGEPLSENERILRNTIFHRHAVLAYLEKRFPDQLDRMKQEVFCPIVVSK
jgi:hypothetical protein